MNKENKIKLAVIYVDGNWDFIDVNEDYAEQLLEHCPYLFNGKEIDRIVKY